MQSECAARKGIEGAACARPPGGVEPNARAVRQMLEASEERGMNIHRQMHTRAKGAGGMPGWWGA